MKGLKHAMAIVAMGVIMGAGTVTAQAQHRHAPDFHGRDYHRLVPRDRAVWRGGSWYRGWHDGRYGWWWRLGIYWYLYPQPIYPYPTYIPPAIIVQQAPPVPTGLPPAQYWYYCDNPQGYYPYVASCNGPWRPVPATPPSAPPR